MRLSTLMLLWIVSSSCAENEAASKKCKTTASDSKSCQSCCESEGANGYKYIDGDCSCLGG